MRNVVYPGLMKGFRSAHEYEDPPRKPHQVWFHKNRAFSLAEYKRNTISVHRLPLLRFRRRGCSYRIHLI